MKLKVAIIGLGYLGQNLAGKLIEDQSFELTALIDSDPSKQGLSIAGIAVSDDLESNLKDIDLVFITTNSLLNQIKETLVTVIKHKVSIVSSCEELIFPYYSHPQLSQELDQLAKLNGVQLLGTGINPGFLMDYLITVCSKAVLNVKAIKYTRHINTAHRRVTFQDKVGLGLSLGEFKNKQAQGRIGHVGFRQSVDMLLHYFNWTLDSYEENIKAIEADGLVQGIHQKAKCITKNKQSIELLFIASAQASDNDHLVLELENAAPLIIDIPSGINGESGTAAMLMNSAALVHKMSPGLKTMLN
jgi:2,4-diaminopentanoate dehydrogenase